ncbi:hypothetical protein TraAM80_05046 [Trypanosoma rangeli]|uniref:Uncharacterized protein n=1 Tax=Trypanosoma rangeli TaxID=5698 RepID=A0A3R7MLJ2_TRYRA|nr:uncharacterized protein TraAM80_05046 [Trypanosoma rangeli]RNF04712.1 hypothetical protein TraAM80_05046 [Trypanosoma rangeli]|eukprot:RNF04712.1 hypothetical protein TraAM80_05046 [Trypanosoma rangeli]
MALAHAHHGGGAIYTLLNEDPPSADALARACRAGCLPYPNRLVRRLIVVPAAAPHIDESSTAESPLQAQRLQKTREANAQDWERGARYAGLLRSHYVPLVPFSTFAAPLKGLCTIPTIAEYSAAAGQPHFARPKEEDYLMCGGFHPGPELYCRRGKPRMGVVEQQTVQLERMYPCEVMPLPPRILDLPSSASVLFPI